jgi:RNA polymerase sigma factor (sigma-70 family)
MKGADLDEIEALYRDRLAAFVRTAVAITDDLESGRDVVQEAFATAVQKRKGYRREAPLEAWLWRIVVNEARDRKRRVVAGPPASVHASDDDHHPDADALRVGLAALPERQRLVAFLRYYADLDYEAIAAVLDVSPGTVGATLNAAHAALRRQLQEVES